MNHSILTKLISYNNCREVSEWGHTPNYRALMSFLAYCIYLAWKCSLWRVFVSGTSRRAVLRARDVPTHLLPFSITCLPPLLPYLLPPSLSLISIHLSLFPFLPSSNALPIPIHAASIPPSCRGWRRLHRNVSWMQVS